MIEARGRTLANALIRQLVPDAARFREVAGRAATLAIVAADDPANQRFVALKQERFREAGIDVRTCWLGAAASTTDVLLHLHGLNADTGIDAVFLQFPLPPAVAADRAAETIAPDKDIDAVGSSNLGRILTGTQVHMPATVGAILQLLEDELRDLRGRSLVLVGRAAVTERCLAVLAVARGATVCLLPPQDRALADAAAGADAIVVTDELPPGTALEHVRNGALLIDAAYSSPPRPADWLSSRALQHLGSYLPQYRNVGPLTVALLMQNTLRAAWQLRD